MQEDKSSTWNKERIGSRYGRTKSSPFTAIKLILDTIDWKK